MRLIIALAGIVINAGTAVSAEIFCSVLSERLSLGEIEPRQIVRDYTAVLEVTCRNTGARGVQDVVRIQLDETDRIAYGEEGKGELKVKVGFRQGAQRVSSDICRKIVLGAGDSVVIDAPILLALRLNAPHHGNYNFAVPFSVNTGGLEGENRLGCP